MPTLSKVLQPAGIEFNKRPVYTVSSRCTGANNFQSRSQTEKTTSPVYKRATSFRYCSLPMSKTSCTFVDMDGGASFLCLDTWLEVACSGAACQFCKCSMALF